MNHAQIPEITGSVNEPKSDHPGTNHGTHFPCIFWNGCVKEAIVSVGHRKKDVSMTLLSNAGGMFPACSVMNHSGVYVYYTKVQLRGQCVICMLTSVLNIAFLVLFF